MLYYISHNLFVKGFNFIFRWNKLLLAIVIGKVKISPKQPKNPLCPPSKKGFLLYFIFMKQLGSTHTPPPHPPTFISWKIDSTIWYLLLKFSKLTSFILVLQEKCIFSHLMSENFITPSFIKLNSEAKTLRVGGLLYNTPPP